MYLAVREKNIQDLGLADDNVFEGFLFSSLCVKKYILPFPLPLILKNPKYV